MEDVVDDVTGAPSVAVAVENGVNGKPASHEGVEVHAEEGHEERVNGDNSGEGEVINPPEAAGGETTSPPGGRKPRLSKGDQSHGPKVVKSKSPRSGDEGQARRRTPNATLPKAPIVQKSDKNEARSAPQDKEASLPDDSKDKRKTQKPLVQHSSVKTAETESNCESSKPRKMGSTPSYGFTFKCDERSEKRREFYSKLEEKIHARELEINNMQAKSKETEEAELKMLRKSLKFKATPMPNFYKETPPAKIELKKNPPTRARSPKLGRPKNKLTSETEENDTTNLPIRLSLEDDKVLHYGVKQSTPSNSVKKPQRKSLPKLPSEETGPTDDVVSTKIEAVGAEGTQSPTGVTWN